MEYADEPRLVFSPLSEEEYCRLYALEMDSYEADAPFYLARLRPDDSVLELGCGTGRLSRLLAPWCREITAGDLSAEMIRRARQRSDEGIAYQLLDMTDFSLSRKFDVIVIPYNTLNLLGSATRVCRCLHQCRKHLRENGRLLLHLYYPDRRLREAAGGKTFQFAILEGTGGEKIVKETLKQYHPAEHTCTLEERYRLRPQDIHAQKRDLRHTLTLYTPQPEDWHGMLDDNGFGITGCHGNYDGTPFSPDNTTLLVEAALR